MQPFVQYYGHKLQTACQKGQYFVVTYNSQLSPLPSTASTLKSAICFTSDPGCLLPLLCLSYSLFRVSVNADGTRNQEQEDRYSAGNLWLQ